MVNELAGWMSDLVSGLQNRIERFDSATGLQAANIFGGFIFLENPRLSQVIIEIFYG